MEIRAEIIRDFQNRLITCLSSSGSLQDLLEIAHEEFLRPMFIKGDGSNIYAITKDYSPDVHPNWSVFIKNVDHKSAEFDSVRSVSEDPEFSRAFSKKGAMVLKSPSYKGMVLHSNIMLNEKRICEVIVLENGRSFSETDVELMDLFSEFIKLHMFYNKERYLSDSEDSSTLTALLENRSVSPLELLNVNNHNGWNSDDELAVAVTDSPSKSDTPLIAVFRDKVKYFFDNSITFIYKNQVVSLINVTRSGGYKNVSRQLNKLVSSESLYCGLSFEFTGLERMIEFYNLALMACSIADRLNKQFLNMYSAAHIRITERLHNITDLQNLIHPDLIRLDRIDPHRTSHYLETLYAYLLCGGNFTDTANYLGLHRNSLIYRMNRIQSIVKSDLNDVHNKHFLLISYLLMGISF